MIAPHAGPLGEPVVELGRVERHLGRGVRQLELEQRAAGRPGRVNEALLRVLQEGLAILLFHAQHAAAPDGEQTSG